MKLALAIVILLVIVFTGPLVVVHLWQWCIPVLLPGALKSGMVSPTIPYKLPFVYMLITCGAGILKGTVKFLLDD